MKTLIVILLSVVSILLFLNLSAPASSNVTSIALFVFDDKDMSCGHWRKTSDQRIVRAQLTEWSRGFVTAYNYYNPYNQVDSNSDLSEETVELYYDKYCKENPLSNTYKATLSLIDDLKKQQQT